MERPIPAVLLKTDTAKREAIYKAISLMKGVIDYPISLEDIPNFEYDTGVRLWAFDKNLYHKIMQLDGVIGGRMKAVGDIPSVMVGTGKFPKSPDEERVFIDRPISAQLDLTTMESDAELEEWARKQAEKEKRLR